MVPAEAELPAAGAGEHRAVLPARYLRRPWKADLEIFALLDFEAQRSEDAAWLREPFDPARILVTVHGEEAASPLDEALVRTAR